MIIEYVSSEEMDVLLANAYPKLSKDFSDKRRRERAQADVSKLNKVIRALGATQLVDSNRTEYAEDAELMEGVAPGLLEQWKEGLEKDYRFGSGHAARGSVAEGRAIQQHFKELWTPGDFELGLHEGAGPSGIGIALPDKDYVLRDGRRHLLSVMHSALGYDVSQLSVHKTPVMQVYDTSPLSVANLQFYPAPYPVSVPAKEPHAYIDNRRR
jgi:hypothetical protein